MYQAQPMEDRILPLPAARSYASDLCDRVLFKQPAAEPYFRLFHYRDDLRDLREALKRFDSPYDQGLAAEDCKRLVRSFTQPFPPPCGRHDRNNLLFHALTRPSA